MELPDSNKFIHSYRLNAVMCKIAIVEMKASLPLNSPRRVEHKLPPVQYIVYYSYTVN